MKNKIILQSLAMDLKRVSLLLHNKSYKAAERFSQEALRRKAEVDTTKLKPYVKKLLPKLETALKAKKKEEVLMYSTIIQNHSLTL